MVRGWPPETRKGARRHQSVQFDEVAASFDKLFVRSGALLAFAGQLPERPRVLGVGDLTQLEAEIPNVQ